MNSLLYAPLGELAKLNPTFHAQGVAPDELVDFLPMAAVSAELTTVSATEQRTFQSVQKGYTNFVHGDVLLAKITPCFENGKIAFAQLNTDFGFGSTEFHVIRADKARLDGRYLVHFLRRDEIRLDGARNMTGSGGQRRVPKHYINSLSVPLPALSEQRRIAAILDQVDALRAKRRETLAQLDRLTQSIFIEMFGDPVTNPLSWTYRSLDEITQKVTDGEHLNPAFADSGMPIVMAGNVLVDHIDLESAKRVEASLGQQFRKKCGPEFGDLLIVGRGATIGRLCRVNLHDSFCLMGSVILVKPDRSMLDERYLSGMLAMPSMHAMLYKTSGSSAQQAIYLKDVKKLACPVPPLSLQHIFAIRIQAVEGIKAIQRTALTELDNLFASLQHRAFRGKL